MWKNNFEYLSTGIEHLLKNQWLIFSSISLEVNLLFLICLAFFLVTQFTRSFVRFDLNQKHDHICFCGCRKRWLSESSEQKIVLSSLFFIRMLIIEVKKISMLIFLSMFYFLTMGLSDNFRRSVAILSRRRIFLYNPS